MWSQANPASGEESDEDYNFEQEYPVGVRFQ
jgi:hypothetical protein